MKIFFFLLLVLFVILNFKTYELQSMNHQKPVKIETTYLLKSTNFFERYFEIKKFIKNNFKDIKKLSDLEKVNTIFIWINKNILLDYNNVIDDHHLNIIKRKKGTDDQRALVFAMILNFVNIDSFYKCNNSIRSCLTFVKINNKWFYYDINEWTIDDLNNYKNLNLFDKVSTTNSAQVINDKYVEIFNSINKNIDKELHNNTSYIQTPLRRLVYFINEKK